VQFGFDIPAQGPMANPDSAAELARAGEAMGFGYLYVSDHIVVPKTIRSPYPYNAKRKLPGADNYLEQLTLLTFLAAHTRRIKLLTSVTVIPYRDAVFTAKSLATIDVLSNGRLVLGAGVGWMKEEFEAVGAPPFEQRGTVTDEYLRAFVELWTDKKPSFKGRHVRFSDIAFEPKPVQKPHPPIWIGGESPYAIRRAATLGNGWYPISYDQTYPITTPTRMRECLTELRKHAKAVGRSLKGFQVTYHAGMYDPKHVAIRQGGKRKNFTGTPAQVAGDIRAFQDAGVDNVFFLYPGNSVKALIASAEQFMDKVGSRVKG